MITLQKIAAALRDGKELTAEEIYAAEVFETKQALFVSLGTYSTREPRYLLRDKKGATFTYRLNPDVKLPADVADAELRAAAKTVVQGPAAEPAYKTARPEPKPALAPVPVPKPAPKPRPAPKAVMPKTAAPDTPESPTAGAMAAGTPAGPAENDPPAAEEGATEHGADQWERPILSGAEPMEFNRIPPADSAAGSAKLQSAGTIPVPPSDGWTYEQVLADLRAKRAMLDNAIAAIEPLVEVA